jgi:hypothetical protein
VFPAHGGNITGTSTLLHTGGRLSTYLRHALLLPHGLTNFVHRNKAYKQDGSRVKLSYCPQPGDTIVLMKTTSR